MGSQMPSSEQLSECFSHRWILFCMVLQKMRNLVHAHPQMAPSPCSSTHRHTSVHAQPHPTNFFFLKVLWVFHSDLESSRSCLNYKTVVIPASFVSVCKALYTDLQYSATLLSLWEKKEKSGRSNQNKA